MPKGKEDEKIAKKKFKAWLIKNQFGHRLLIAILMILFIALFIHFREIRIEIPEQGTLAKRYMVAQVDFSYSDESATQLHQQEAIKDITPIYKIDENEVKKRKEAFEKGIIENGYWRQQLPKTTFEEIYNVLGGVERQLISAKFTSDRTLRKMQELNLSTVSFFSLFITENAMVLPADFWENIASVLYEKNDPAPVNYVINSLSQYRWKLLLDQEATISLEQAVEASIPDTYTQVYAGNRILSQGEKVTSVHVSKLQAMKKALAEERKIWSITTIGGSILLAFCFVLTGMYYFRVSKREMLESLQKLSLYGTIIIITLILTKVSEYFLISERTQLINFVRYPLFVPFAAILVTVLLGLDVALFTAFFLSVIMTFSLAMDQGRFLILNSISGVVSALIARSMRKRKQVFAVAFKVWLSSIPILLVFILLDARVFQMAFLEDILGSFACLIITAILIVGLLPVLETLFHIMTDITLMEYMDPSNELLRRLSLEAPGTYQHSLVVGSLSEAAAQAIGANGLFCRVTTLYHDIGKLFNPHYFTENQMGGFNIHQLLTPIESTQVIIAHVSEGEALARKYGLPQNFIDIIREHHGTTLVYYFYAKQIEQMGGDKDAVDESQFRYPGPKPRSKESAIIMIADTVEAASRSLEDATEEAIEEMIERLVGEKAGERQFDECQLTFEELGIVKKTIARTLAVTRHLRIKYPERK